MCELPRTGLWTFGTIWKQRLRAETFKFNDVKNAHSEDTDMSDIFRELEGLLQKQLKQHWEIRSLQQYLENEDIPNGLLCNKIPAQDLISDKFEEK